MAYIGKDPAQFKRALHEKDTFTGDGSTTIFDLTSDASSANEIQVFVDNIRQEPGASDAYTLGEDGSGNLRRITFTAAPDNGAEIYVLNPKTIDSNLIVPSDNSVTESKITTGAVTSTKILDGTIVNADINACAAIADTKLGTISTACKVATTAISQPGSSSVYLAGDGSWGAIDTTQQDTNAFNISLLGFKMAVNEGLTVFNLVDGVVDEFNDESGTDEAEGSNDLYCGTSDYYINSTTPDGSSSCISAGFSMTAVTEPDTSTAGTNPSVGVGTFGSFTVSGGLTSVSLAVWGAGGGGGGHSPSGTPSNTYNPTMGGGGGFASGTFAVTPGQTLYISAGEGGTMENGATRQGGFFGGGNAGASTPGKATGPQMQAIDSCSSGGGVAGVFTVDYPTLAPAIGQPTAPAPQGPTIVMIAGAGGGGGGHAPSTSGAGCTASPVHIGGVGGGLTGGLGGAAGIFQTDRFGGAGGGGDQEQGGQGASSPSPCNSDPGAFLEGGDANHPDRNTAAGGAGYFGGGMGGYGITPQSPGDNRSGGGGSSYYGHPQVTSGATEAAPGLLSSPPDQETIGGGTANPLYPSIPYSAGAGNNPGVAGTTNTNGSGTDGYVFLTGSACASTTSTTIVSEPFTSTSVPTTARIVVFEENVDTPTLNTDVIASISRDGGSTFTNATLSDSGYVTGSSGQRILTGQATISGQPSGQSMRWKLALANNAVKIHGVSLQWA